MDVEIEVLRDDGLIEFHEVQLRMSCCSGIPRLAVGLLIVSCDGIFVKTIGLSGKVVCIIGVGSQLDALELSTFGTAV